MSEDKLTKAFITVLINDQAYLYAEMQALKYEKENGWAPDEDIYLRWQDEFKEESARMVERLLEEEGFVFEDVT